MNHIPITSHYQVPTTTTSSSFIHTHSFCTILPRCDHYRSPSADDVQLSTLCIVGIVHESIAESVHPFYNNNNHTPLSLLRLLLLLHSRIVNIGSCFVDHQYLTLLQDRSCKTHQLFLTNTQIRSTFTHQRMQTIRHHITHHFLQLHLQTNTPSINSL